MPSRAPKSENHERHMSVKSVRFVLISAVLLIVAALSFILFACDDNPAPESAAGTVYSGKITFENSPFPGVSVLVNGEEKCVSSADGIFILRGLTAGDKITFSLDGYEFIPDKITVAKADLYDLRVSALLKVVTPPDPDDNPSGGDEPSEPDNPSVPDNPEEPDKPDIPDENVKTSLLAPINVSFVTKDGKVYLVFALDGDAENVNVDLVFGDNRATVFSAGVKSIPESGFTDASSGCTAYFISETTADGNAYREFVLDITNVFGDAGTYGFNIVSGADALNSAASMSPEYTFKKDI